MKTKYLFPLFLPVFLLVTQNIFAQKLKPGFDKAEYIEMVKIAQKAHIDLDKWDSINTVPDPGTFKFIYRSPVVGFDNIWDLWVNKDGIAVISIRGSIQTATSFLANIYAAMVAAKGTLHLQDGLDFPYDLSDDPKAAVHVGWLISMAYLSRDIVPKIDSCYKAGIKDFIITGHSQGGGITFLMTSYLENLRHQNRIPIDIRFKTYCSAGPKPGNLYYAYDFENLTANGWGYNVVSSADWVPEVPFSVQTTSDFNTVNPFTDAKKIIKKQKFLTSLALTHAYNRMSKPSEKLVKRYQRYLGGMVSKAVKKQLPGFTEPVYFKSNNYVRTGVPVILYAGEDFYQKFPMQQNSMWQYHLLVPYLYLAEKLP